MKISVIVPVYNLESYLAECIESLVNQLLKEIEIICVNDGSSDSSLEILKNYKSVYNNIKIINQENNGQGFSRNIAMSYAKGEYIYFLDGDDYLHSEALMTCYNEAKENDLDIITFDATVIYEKNYTKNFNENFERKHHLESKVKTGIEFIEEAVLKECFRTETSLNLYKKSFLEKNNIKFSEQRIYEDIIQVFDSFIFAERVKYISDKLLYKRVRKESVSTNEVNKTNIDCYYNMTKELIERFYKVESYNNLNFQKCILYKIQHYINKIIQMCDYLSLDEYKNKVIRYIYNKVNIININSKTIKSVELAKYLINYDVLNECIKELNKETLSKNEFINIIKRLLIITQKSTSYNKLSNLKLLEEAISNILLNFDFSYERNKEKIICLKESADNLLNQINEKKNINVFFYGNDKYNLLNTSLKHEIIYIQDINEVKNSINTELYNDINILIISEETVSNNIEITQYFNNIIYYDKVMNYLFEVGEKVYYNNYDYNYLVKSIEKAINKGTESIIVGNSYPLHGIEERLLKDNSVKLALASQDLYYAYKLAEKVINENENIKKCIIGSGYYIVNHDLSRAKHLDSVQRVKYVYYPALKDKHNSIEVEEVHILKLADVMQDILIKYLFDLDILDSYFKSLLYIENGGYFNKNLTREGANMFKGLKLDSTSEEEKIRLGKWRAEQHNKLEKYSQTNEEFKGIFEEFISFLRSKNVKPILVVFPGTKYYKNYLDKRYKDEFYNVVNKINKDNIIQVIDFFENDIFTEDDFIDFDHLGDSGAIKVTNELNKLIY